MQPTTLKRRLIDPLAAVQNAVAPILKVLAKQDDPEVEEETE